jgi:hypothetical protein
MPRNALRHIEVGHVEVFHTPRNARFHAIWRAQPNLYYYTPPFTTKEYAIRRMVKNKDTLNSGTAQEIQGWFNSEPEVIQVTTPARMLHRMGIPPDAASALLNLKTPR